MAAMLAEAAIADRSRELQLTIFHTLKVTDGNRPTLNLQTRFTIDARSQPLSHASVMAASS